MLFFDKVADTKPLLLMDAFRLDGENNAEVLHHSVTGSKYTIVENNITNAMMRRVFRDVLLRAMFCGAYKDAIN